MADTSIQWTEKTWNPVTGCRKISPGCTHCYADMIAGRFWAKQYPLNTDGTPRSFTNVRWHYDRLEQPLHWKKPARIFVNSMSDLFHEDVPFEFIDRVFAVMAARGNHTFQVLTKRPERMLAWCKRVTENGVIHANLYQSGLIDFYSRHGVDLTYEHQVPAAPTPELRFIYNSATGIDPRARTEDQKPNWKIPECHWREWPLNNVWLGVSVENQKYADERIPLLLQTPAAVRWVSAEPLLGPVDLTRFQPSRQNLSDYWVVVGGESGAGARPMELQWARSLRDQCKTNGVPFFMKQLGGSKGSRGEMADFPEDLRIREYPVTK